MSKSFYDLDYYIEINEKRDADLKAEYDKTLGKVSNIIIIYSGISVFLIAICKDFFNQPMDYVYSGFLVTFVILFILSCWYTVKFLFPNLNPALGTPRSYYSDLRLQLEAALPNASGALTPQEMATINEELKRAYILELERNIELNMALYNHKQASYFNAFRYAILCIFPFIGCLFFYILKPEQPTMVKILNTEKSGILVLDTVRILDVSSMINSYKNR